MALSATYVDFGGTQLVQFPEFVVIDGYAFSIAFPVGLVAPVGWLLHTIKKPESTAICKNGCSYYG